MAFSPISTMAVVPGCMEVPYIRTTAIPKHKAIVNDSSVPVNTYSDFSLPDDASLNQSMDLALLQPFVEFNHRLPRERCR